MKVSLIQEHLAKALLYINKAVSNRPNIPVLANVLLETEKGRMKLSATNLEIGISTWIGATVGEEGKTTVSARTLSEFVNSLKSGKVDIFTKDQVLEVDATESKAEFFTIPAEDFPRVPEAEGEAVLELPALDFADAIAQTAFAAGADEARPVLTGILFETSGTELTMVAVDGFRLSKKILKLKQKTAEELKEIVPAKALSEVEKLIRDNAKEGDTIKAYLLGNKNQLLFKIADVELSTRLIEGKFPDYQAILPADKVLHFKVKKSDFVDTLKVVTIFARNVVGYKAKFAALVDDKKLTLSAQVADVGNNETMADVKEIEGKDFETGFNVKYLADMVNAINSEDITFETNGPTAPGVFLDSKDKNFIHVIMPMRLE